MRKSAGWRAVRWRCESCCGRRPRALRKAAKNRIRTRESNAFSLALPRTSSGPNRKEIDTFYKLNRSRFVMPETIRVAHIVKNVTETFSRDEALAEIRKAKEALDSGAEFSKVAEQFSDCPGDGGDLGWFGREAMVQEFDDNVFALAEGETSDVFETRFGFHIAHLNGRRPAGIQPLSLLRESIAKELFERRKRRALDHYFDALLSESRVEWRAATP